MIDNVSGGALGDMTPVEARNLIEKMASNFQQFSARNDAIVLRGVHEVATDSSSSTENKKLEGKLDALVNLVTQLAMNQKSASTPVARVCGLCSSVDHHTDLCPSLQQSRVNEQPEAYAANIYNGPHSNKSNNSRIIMIFQATDTIQVGEIIQILDGQVLHNNNSLSLLSRMLLVQASHMFLLQYNSSNNNSHNKDNKQLRLLLNLP